MAITTIQLASLASGAITSLLTFDDVTLLVQSISITSDRSATVTAVHPVLGSFAFAIPSGSRVQDLTGLGIVLAPQLLDSGFALPSGVQVGLREGS